MDFADKLSLGPQFEHDCDHCIFLGRYDGQDLYFHPQRSQIQGDTVISRYGVDGDYSSGLMFGKEKKLGDPGIQHLRVAYLLARDLGLVD